MGGGKRPAAAAGRGRIGACLLSLAGLWRTQLGPTPAGALALSRWAACASCPPRLASPSLFRPRPPATVGGRGGVMPMITVGGKRVAACVVGAATRSPASPR